MQTKQPFVIHKVAFDCVGIVQFHSSDPVGSARMSVIDKAELARKEGFLLDVL